MVGGAVADNPDNFIVGEDNGYGVAVISGDFGVGEEVLELFGAGHAEGDEVVAVSAAADCYRLREPVHVKESGVGLGVCSLGRVASSTVAVIFQPGSRVSPGTVIGRSSSGRGVGGGVGILVRVRWS